MEGPRFRCPPEFEAAPPGGALGGPSTEIWIIRAPADLCPHSLDGCAVPLAGGGQLQPPQDGDAPPQLYRVRGGPGGGGAGAPLLVTPPRCAPPPRGCISITRTFGCPPCIGGGGGGAGGAPPGGAAPGPPPRKKKHRGGEAAVTPGGRDPPH